MLKVHLIFVVCLLSVTQVSRAAEPASPDGALPDGSLHNTLDNVAMGVLPYNGDTTGQPVAGQALNLPQRQIILQHMHQKGLISAEELATRKAKLREQDLNTLNAEGSATDKSPEAAQANSAKRSVDDNINGGKKRLEQTDEFNEDPLLFEANRRRDIRNDEREDLARERKGRDRKTLDDKKHTELTP